MPVVQYKQTAHACQVEGIPTSLPTDKKPKKDEEQEVRAFKRSVDGALHLRPGGTMVLSADEYNWLKTNRKSVFKDLLLLAEDPPEVAQTAAVAPTGKSTSGDLQKKPPSADSAS